MSISGITRQSLISTLGYLNPEDTQDVSDTSSLASMLSNNQQTTNPYANSNSGASATGISKVGYILSNLAKLQKDHPESFKENAAAMAKDFHDAASQCGDTLQRYSLESMAAQFSNASISGSMRSINLGSTTSNLMRAYAGQSSLSLLDYMNGAQGTNFSGQVTSILNNNLSNYMTGGK